MTLSELTLIEGVALTLDQTLQFLSQHQPDNAAFTAVVDELTEQGLTLSDYFNVPENDRVSVAAIDDFFLEVGRAELGNGFALQLLTHDVATREQLPGDPYCYFVLGLPLLTVNMSGFRTTSPRINLLTRDLAQASETVRAVMATTYPELSELPVRQYEIQNVCDCCT